VAAKRADRDATEGLVIAKTNADSTVGVLVCVNCETDFVAKNADFTAMAERIDRHRLGESVSAASKP
jgi:elongation factor Ts